MADTLANHQSGTERESTLAAHEPAPPTGLSPARPTTSVDTQETPASGEDLLEDVSSRPADQSSQQPQEQTRKQLQQPLRDRIAQQQRSRNGGQTRKKMIKKKGKLLRMLLAVAGPKAVPRRNGLHIETMKNESLNALLVSLGGGSVPMSSAQWAKCNDYPFEVLALLLGITEDEAKALCEQTDGGRYVLSEAVLKQLLCTYPATFANVHRDLVAKARAEYCQWQAEKKAPAAATDTAESMCQLMMKKELSLDENQQLVRMEDEREELRLRAYEHVVRMYGRTVSSSGASNDGVCVADSDGGASGTWSPQAKNDRTVDFDNTVVTAESAAEMVMAYSSEPLPAAANVPVPPPMFNTAYVEAEVHNFMQVVGGHEAMGTVQKYEQFLRIYEHLVNHLIPSIVRNSMEP